MPEAVSEGRKPKVGAIRIYMPAPNGLVHAMTRRFVEIDRPHRLVFATAGIDEEGEAMFEVLNTVAFAGVAGGTEIIAGGTGDECYCCIAVACGHVAGLERESGPAGGICGSALTVGLVATSGLG